MDYSAKRGEKTGYRWQGDQEFYMFIFNISGSSASRTYTRGAINITFYDGENAILISRSTMLNSLFNKSLEAAGDAVLHK